MRHAVLLAMTVGAVLSTLAQTEAPELFLACSPENDLLQVLPRAGVDARRYDRAEDAVAEAPDGAGLLVLADGYPESTTAVDAALFDAAAAKGLRLYVEYPSFLPGLALEAPRATEWERAVVASDFVGGGLAPMRILAIHGCHFVPVKTGGAAITLARVAGFDTAVFGLPAGAAPVAVRASTRHGARVNHKAEPVYHGALCPGGCLARDLGPDSGVGDWP